MVAIFDFANKFYVIVLGSVGDGTAASVAQAVDAVYTPAGRAGTVPAGGGTSYNTTTVTPGENIAFVGQVTQSRATSPRPAIPSESTPLPIFN